MFCERCGSRLPDGAKFCAGCGARTEPTTPVYAAPTAPAAGPAQTYPPYAEQQAYVPPQPVPYYAATASDGAEPLRVGQYVGMFVLMAVPLLNIILLLVWGFGGSVNPNRRNFARAALILGAITLIFWIVGGGVMIGAMSELMGELY